MCKDTEWIYDPVNNSARECACRQSRIQERRQNFADIPKHFLDKRLDSFDTEIYNNKFNIAKAKNAYKIARCYVDEFENFATNGIGLYISSATKGSGKTRMAVSIANELLSKGYRVKFATAIAILNEIKSTWQKKSWQDDNNTESRLLNELIQADVLIIDDFGQEKVSEWVNNEFYHIINERYVLNKTTIYTSNVLISELLYDERITTRVKEKSVLMSFPEVCVRDIIAESNNELMNNKIQEMQ